jgi:hypothetical protein
MLPQIAFERLGLEMTATVDEIDARMREIAEDPKMKLTGEDRMKVFMMYEAAKWARRYIRDPSSCRSMSLEEHRNWSKMQSEKNQVEPTLEVKYQQLKLEVDEEVRRHSGVEAKQRNENTELKRKIQKLEAQLADKVDEIEKLKKSAEDERARSVRRLEEECQHRYKIEDHSKLRDSLFDVVSKDRYRLQCQARWICKDFEELLGCVEEMKGILVPLKEDVVVMLQGGMPSVDELIPLKEIDTHSTPVVSSVVLPIPTKQTEVQVCNSPDEANADNQRKKRKHVKTLGTDKDTLQGIMQDFLQQNVQLVSGSFVSSDQLLKAFLERSDPTASRQSFYKVLPSLIVSTFPDAIRKRTERANGYTNIALRDV